MQRSFAEFEGFRKQRKLTRRESSSRRWSASSPWRRLEALLEPVYPKAGNGRRPYRLGTMLRIHLLQHWYGYSDRGYADKTREPDRPRGEDDIGPRWFVPFKRRKGCDTTPEQKRLNRLMAGLRAAVEPPFRRPPCVHAIEPNQQCPNLL